MAVAVVTRRKKTDKSADLLASLETSDHGRELEKLQRQIASSRNVAARAKSAYRRLAKEHQELQRASGIIAAAGAPTLRPIRPKKSSKQTEATAFMVASDWHVEEVVKPEAVNGLNEYNSEISQSRAREFFRSGLRLLQIVQKDVRVNTLVVPMLGDFITNHLHDENAENNDKLPIEAIVQAQGYLSSGLRFLIDNTECNIIVPCHSGNHGRTTRFVHAASEHGHSLEFLMYKNMEMAFSDEKRVRFEVTTAYHSYLPVYDTMVRLHHGHAVKYGGGVGGITIPINKAVAQWNYMRRADLDIFGHFHQFFDGGNFICNGSLIGWSPYGIRIKAKFEKPRQAFTVIDNRHGRTWTAPIIVERV